MNELIQTLAIFNKKNITINSKADLFVSLLAFLKSRQQPVILVLENIEDFYNAIKNLRFFLGDDKDKIFYFQDYDHTPFHATATDPMATMDKSRALFSLSLNGEVPLLVLSAKALLTKLPPLQNFQKYAQLLIKDQKIDREQFLRSLQLMGYSKVSEVLDRGTFCVRGSLIEVFANEQKYPIRIDLFGDVIEILKFFDPSTKRSISDIKEIIIGPAREIILDNEAKHLAEQKLFELADEINFPTQKIKSKLNEINNELYFFGIEKITPAFFKETFCILEAYKNDPIIIFHNKEKIFSSLENFSKELEDLYQKSILRGDLVFSPQNYFLDVRNLKTLLEKFSCIDINYLSSDVDFSFNSNSTADLRQAIIQETISTNQNEAPHLLRPLIARVRQLHQESQAVILVVASKEHEEQLKTLLSQSKLNLASLKTIPRLDQKNTDLFKPHIHAYIHVNKNVPAHGAELPFLGITIISEEDVFGRRKQKDEAKKQKGFSTSLSDLDVGDLVVHVDHGLGRFDGLKRLNLNGVANDYVLITYAKEEKLYLPVHRINLIKPYGITKDGEIKLDKLGGTAWATKKSKVKEAVIAMAQDLLKLYAKREMVERPQFIAPDEHFVEFEANFAFEATLDQQKAIDDVIADMQKSKPMDRLVCGDVGYGKTEVAMRAAMLAVLSQRQVAILAPTTVLAQQHGITFKERFSNTGVNIAVISRFQSSKEIKQILIELANQKIDIVIGTHRLLSPDINFKNLGLIVIDEEQRFGIKAKEHLKKMRTKVDVLTMSATPIPRTLQMSYLGIRDLSIIDTPPVDRKSTQTFITQFDDEVIKEAILRELNRGGQIYFVHNRVHNINAMADYLKSLVPLAKITTAHGQMSEDDLEERMLQFINHEIDILVCTTIIETGIDVAKANTMFINDADNFGLSQLYQLRGRIGRSKERAFAYMLIDSAQENLTQVAKTRLEILHRFSELGAGFKIAQHDLELRGAGDLLGKNQHGHMAAVGFDLYAELLKDAVEGLRGKAQEEEIEPEVGLPVSALIPENYCPDLHERMNFYQKLAMAHDENEINNIIFEMEDLLGEIPEEVLALKEISLLKLTLKKLKILKLNANKVTNGYHMVIYYSNKPKLIQTIKEDNIFEACKKFLNFLE